MGGWSRIVLELVPLVLISLSGRTHKHMLDHPFAPIDLSG